MPPRGAALPVQPPEVGQNSSAQVGQNPLSQPYADSRPSPAFGIDYQSTYLRAWLNQAGVIAIDEVRFQPTLLTPDPTGALEQAKRAAMDLAQAHGRV